MRRRSKLIGLFAFFFSASCGVESIATSPEAIIREEARFASMLLHRSKPTTTTTTTLPPWYQPTTTTTTTMPPHTHSRPSYEKTSNPPPPGEAVERWRDMVTVAFTSYGLESEVNKAMQVIACESGGDPNAENSSSGAAGLFQHLPRVSMRCGLHSPVPRR